MSSYSSTTDTAEKAARSAADNNSNSFLSLPAVSPVQKMADEEEPAQVKADPVQRAALEEETVQGKFQPFQKKTN